MNPKRLLVCCLILVSAVIAAASQTTDRSITIDRIAQIKYPTSSAWSPDGERVAFLWDAWGKQDLFVVTPGEEPVQLTDFPVDPDMLITDIVGVAWASSEEILFGKDGQLWTVSPTKPGPKRVSGLAGAGSFALSPNRGQIAFSRDGQLWLASLETKYERQLTFIEGGLRASAPVFSPDGQWITFGASRSTTIQYPLPFNGNLIRSYVNANEERRLGVVSTLGSNVTWIPTVGNARSAQFTADGSILYEEISPDRKTRELKVTSVGGVPRTIWKDYDDRWYSPHRRDSKLLVSPDGESVAFVSDREGWVHLYVMPVDAASEKEAKQLTSGNYLSALGSWSPDSDRIAYHHGVDGNPMERFIDIVEVATGESDTIVAENGVNLDPAFSPDGTNLVYGRTDAENSLDLFAVAAEPRSESVRLSDSMPPGMDRTQLTRPVAVEFPSRHDGQPVPATLMVHEDLDLTERHPAVVWIHGSGSDQNYLGWHPASYRMYYSMHQYLAQQGYVILTPDYRGSSGYSRDWSTGHHMSIGVTDTADVASGADYLKTLDYVDPDRIGVWGLSYGGFMTLQALWRDPTLWRAGIDVAGVVDWAYRGAGMNLSGFTIPRLGSPAENPEIYEVSSSYKHMDMLERPLMVMHGTDDRNVTFHDSLILIDQLVKLGKDFETVIYPGEIHFFRRDIVLRDAWRRAEQFFDRHLKNGPKLSSQ